MSETRNDENWKSKILQPNGFIEFLRNPRYVNPRIQVAIASIILTMVPSNAFATGTVPSRLAGTSATQTAVVIAEQTGWTGTAILASSESYGESDALTAGPLAKFLNAPILLQEAGPMLNTDTKAELIKLNVKKVYVTSGTAVINQAVLDQLTGMGITVISLAGVDRFETSVNIARKMVALGAPVNKVAVAYGWLNQDALSIASIAAASNEPILLTEKTSVPDSVQAFLAASVNVTSSDVIGGTGVISDAVKAEFPNATRHYGKTAFDTNNQVIKDFSSFLDFNNVYMANIVTGIDAITGAPLAAQTKSAIVLTDGTIQASDATTFVRSKLTTSSVVTALGGESVVPENVRMQLRSGLSPLPAVDFAKPGTITTVAGMYGHLGYSGDGGPATNSELNTPTSVAVDASGNLYIADMNGIKKMDKNGLIAPVIGEDFGSSGNEFSNTEIFGPYGVAIDLASNLYVTEKCVVRKTTAPIS